MSNLELKVEKKIDEKSFEGLVNEKKISDEMKNYTYNI